MLIHTSLKLGTHISLTIHNGSYTLHTTVSVYMNEIKVWMYIYYWQWQSRITSIMVVVLSFWYKMKFVVFHKIAIKLQCTFKWAW